MTVQLLIQLVYLITGIIYGVFSLRIVYEGRNDSSNRLLATLFGLMSFWAVCMMAAYAATDHDVALAWRRSAGLGWGTVFSFLLHFVLIISGHEKCLRRKIVLALIYAPVAVNLFVLVLYAPTANAQFDLQLHQGVWISHYVDSFWNRWHSGYYATASILSIALLVRWHLKTSDEIEKRQSRALFITFTAVFVISLFTDFVGARVPKDQIPFQAGIVTIMIPVVAIYYIARKYAFLSPSEPTAPADAQQIMTDRHRHLLYQFFGWTFYAASFIHVFFSTVVSYPHAAPDMFVPIMMWFVSLQCGSYAIMWMRRSKMSTRKQELVVFLLILLFDLELMVAFNFTANTTVWATIFLLLLLTVIFENNRLMLLACVMHIAVQMYFAVTQGPVQVTISTWQHSLRVVLVVAGMYLAYFVNRIYVFRLRENEQQTRMQRALTDVAGSLATLNLSAPLEPVRAVLGSIGRYMDAASVIYLRSSAGQVGAGYVWDGLSSREMTTEERSALIPLVKNRDASRRGPLAIDPDNPGTAGQLGHTFQAARGITSFWLVPLVLRGDEQHDLILMRGGDAPCVEDESHDFLRIASSSLANYFTRVSAEQELMYLSTVDQLTGLNRRDVFARQARERLASYNAENETPALLFVSLSGIKEINARGGHATGDKALKICAQRLRELAEPDDVIARFSGVDFLCLTTQENIDITREKAEAIIAALGEPIQVGDHQLYVNACVGVAIYPWDGRSVETLTHSADFAVYAAKRRGHNQVQFYSFQERSQASYTLELRASLRYAVPENQLFLMYQPQIDLNTRRITGMEALVRWRHPTLGVVPPASFIPLAEEMGLLTEINTWVLETACRQNRQWISQGLASAVISVNFSLTQFMDSDVPGLVGRVLRKTGLAPEYLEMEITEEVAGKPSPEMRQALRSLSHMGVGIAIDDFGTEYSNLGRLADIPFHRIKLDMSLIRAYTADNPRSGIIIQNVISMAKELNVQVVAEGVETLEQATFLAHTGCDTAQGYYFFRPLTAEDAEKALFVQTLGAARSPIGVL